MLLIKRLPILCLAVFLALPACGKKADDKDGNGTTSADMPPPPSPFTVSLDLSVTEGATNTDSDAAGLRGDFAPTQRAHTEAGLIVMGVSGSLASQLIIPVLLLKGAASAKANKVTDTSFLWSYDFDRGGAKFTANLTGTKDQESGTNAFSMSVTRAPANSDGCCTNFLFFSGTNNPSTGAGTWQIFDPTRPTGQEKLFGVTYSYKSVTERTLTYTVSSDRPATQKFGSGTTVLYNVKGTVVTMTYQDSSESGSRIISWDKDTLAGSIVDPQGTKLCWDAKTSGYADRTCSVAE